MILFFASSLQEYDPQTRCLLHELKKQRKKYILINPLSYSDLEKISLVCASGELIVRVDNKNVSVDSVLMSRRWRTDCIIDLPDSCIYSNLFRYKANTFLEEIEVGLQKCAWLPGTRYHIKKAEIKSNLLQNACKAGLVVPQQTITSFAEPHKSLYRKVLGFPFSISFNQDIREEVGITLFNSSEKPEKSCESLPWQYQSQIMAQAHVRCFVLNDQIWSVKTDLKNHTGRDLREIHAHEELSWESCVLPRSTTNSLLELMRKMKLCFSCPEFLLDKDGNYVFIDLNPCGDWYGFFDDQTSQEIAREIVSKL